jgi:hypothetical protein
MRRIWATFALIGLLGGCASGVRHIEVAPKSAIVAGQKFASVALSLSEEAKVKHAENIKFNPDQLLSTVRRTMEAKGMLADGATLPKVEIVVKDMRVRSNFTAVMFGIMAGTDSVAGDVIVRSADGKVLSQFEVSASYGLGGFAGGQDDARMGWLYEKFTEHTVNSLTGMGS